MAKKKSRKKHQFKQSHIQTTSNQAANVTEAGTKAPQKISKHVAALAGVDDFGYVGQDVRRILVLAAGFIALQIVLWLLFTHTSLGPRVYGWFTL